MRKLATIRKIAGIDPIPGADAIEVVTVDGWKVVAQKAMGYKVGDVVIYFEIDSWIPYTLAPFLSKGQEPREFNGVKGERLRTIKLRGQVSQGLLMPLAEVNQYANRVLTADGEDVLVGFRTTDDGVAIAVTVEEGADLTELLGIQKWEAPVSPQLVGQVRGTYPTQYAPKTDQERIQNMWKEVDARRNELFEFSLKLDGSSMSIFKIDGELRVASRNLELKIDGNENNTFVGMALAIAPKLEGVDNIVLQGELMGPGIQGNRENFSEHKFFVYDIVDPTTRAKWDPIRRFEFVAKHRLNHVPLIGTYRELPFSTLDEALHFANELKSITHPIAEGLVAKSLVDPEFSFKAISNRFLLKGGD